MDFLNTIGEEKLEALANFLTDYEMLKGWQKLKQAEIAKNAGTTQSAISRLERMKGKPAYDLLQRVSKAVNGSLFLTPMGDVTVTLPYDLQEKARKVAAAQDMTVRDWMNSVLRENVEKAEYSNQ
ncbi:MAG: helix-turn-helix domain-containing protein [Spirochaetota bacterium]